LNIQYFLEINFFHGYFLCGQEREARREAQAREAAALPPSYEDLGWTNPAFAPETSAPPAYSEITKVIIAGALS
jgi:hypothetical protein